MAKTIVAMIEKDWIDVDIQNVAQAPPNGMVFAKKVEIVDGVVVIHADDGSLYLITGSTRIYVPPAKDYRGDWRIT